MDVSVMVNVSLPKPLISDDEYILFKSYVVPVKDSTLDVLIKAIVLFNFPNF